MRLDTVVIEELILRVPGVPQAEAPALVEAVLRRVQQNLRGSGRSGHVRLTQLKVRVSAHANRAELVDALAKELTEALR